MRARELRDGISRRIEGVAESASSFEADQLIIHFLGLSKNDIICDAHAETIPELEAAVKRRVAGEPLQYILGRWEFYGRPILCRRSVLIPRPETELLVDAAVSHIGSLQQSRLLELCCGSGAAGLNIGAQCGCGLVFTDISEDALALCRENYYNLGLENDVRFLLKDALHDYNFDGGFEVVIANPPYITACEMEELPETVSGYEPHSALFGGEDGLLFYPPICKNAFNILRDGGMLALEVGFKQAGAVSGMLSEVGYSDIRTVNDFAGIPRVVKGYKYI